jgi:hypothetical protein
VGRTGLDPPDYLKSLFQLNQSNTFMYIRYYRHEARGGHWREGFLRAAARSEASPRKS